MERFFQGWGGDLIGRAHPATARGMGDSGGGGGGGGPPEGVGEDAAQGGEKTFDASQTSKRWQRLKASHA